MVRGYHGANLCLKIPLYTISLGPLCGCIQVLKRIMTLNVHTQPPYNRHGAIDRTNEEDFIYTGPSNDGLIQTNTGQHLIIKLNEDNKQGYIGTFNIGLNAN